MYVGSSQWRWYIVKCYYTSSLYLIPYPGSTNYPTGTHMAAVHHGGFSDLPTHHGTNLHTHVRSFKHARKEGLVRYTWECYYLPCMSYALVQTYTSPTPLCAVSQLLLPLTLSEHIIPAGPQCTPLLQRLDNALLVCWHDAVPVIR